MLKLALYLTIAVHFVILLANIAAIGWILYYERWWLGFPLITFLINLIFNNWKCPLTNFENYLRTKLGLQSLQNGFVSFYIVKPLKAFFS